MPFLLLIFTAISTFISSLFAQIVLILGRKYATGSLAIITYILVTFAFISCIKAIVAVVASAIIMPPAVGTFIAWFIPSNFISVIASITSGRICLRAYRMALTKLKLINAAS